MVAILLGLSLVAGSAFADVGLPKWGRFVADSSLRLGVIYKVERFTSGKDAQFEVHLRGMQCNLVVTPSPKCSYDYVEVSHPSTKTKSFTRKTSKWNGMHCKADRFIEIYLVKQPITLWDSHADFLQYYHDSRKESEVVNGEVLRAREWQFLDSSCITIEVPADALTAEVSDVDSR
jgi:hypothetical protein